MLITKMQCVGNDFLFVDCFNDIIEHPSDFSAETCDRHFGIGSDALVLILYSDDADFRTEVYDIDGKRISSTPNILVCAAKYAREKGITDKNTISVDTGDGVKYVTVSDEEDFTCTVNAGRFIITPQLVPVDFTGDSFIDKTISAGNTEYQVTCLSVGGNTCTVIFTDNGVELNETKLNLSAPYIEEHNIFPDKTNVIFANVVCRDCIQVRCWKKNEGEAIGCDFGAVSAFAAAYLNNLVDKKGVAELYGGDLEIEISEDDFIYMTAKAEKVFDIEW